MNSFNLFVQQRVSETNIKSPNIPSNLQEQYSQCGEDLMILALATALQRAGLIAGWHDQLVIEIGANHAFGGSNSYLLESKLGTRSILVEANPDLLPDLRKARPQAQIVHAAICPEDRATVVLHRSNHHELSSLDRGFVEDWHAGEVGLASSIEVPAMRMPRFLADHVPAGKQILLLSIDIEGLDLKIIQDTDFNHFRPVMVMLEPSEHYHVDESAHMIDAMRERGYCLFAQTNINLLFVDAALLARLAAQSPHSAKEPAATAPSPEAVTESVESDTAPSFAGVTPAQPTPLADWPLDEAFLQQALQQVEARGVLTLDIFDNAITRRLASPVDVFAEVERRLRSRFGGAVEGLAAAREQAEIQARQRQHQLKGAEEVTLAEIYQELPSLLPALKDWAAIAETELQVERDALIAVPDILELTRRVRAAGKPYAFVSDMYLPQDFLAEILSGLGYEGWQALYVSSELGATKATGRIWECIADDIPLTSIVHIGDNLHSDVDGPRQHGIATLAYRRALSEPRLGTRLDASLVPYSLWQRHSELTFAAKLAQPTEQERWHALGYGFGGHLLTVFVQWLAKRAQQHKIERLYFCARDGHLMQQAWIAAGLDKALPIEHRYLHISRATLNQANAALECSPHHLNAATLSFLSSSIGTTRIDTALQRAGLDRIAPLVADMRAEFGSLEQYLNGPEPAQRFEAILRRHSEAVHTLMQDKYASTMRYLHQEGLADNCRYAVVDMGWHGSLQRSLSGLCRAAFAGATPAIGFYYGLWPAVARNRYLAGPMEACFASGFVQAQHQSELHQGVALLEELHSAAHGTTLGYHSDGERMRPTLQTTSPAQAENDRRIGWFQEGALTGVREIFTGKSPIHASDLNPASARAALGALFLSPSINELDLLARIGHCATFDHSSLEPIVNQTLPSSRESMQQALWHSEWIPGQLRQWQKLGGDDHLTWIRSLVNEMYPNFRPRALRQYQ